MKLVYSEMEMKLDLSKQCPCEWIIESPELFSKYVQELLKQKDGAEEGFVLCDEDRELDFSKYVDIIVNPFHVDINEKRILNKLYADLGSIAYGEELYLETQKMTSDIEQYFYELEHQSPYILEIQPEIDIIAILKALGVKFESSVEDFFENIIQYIKIAGELLKTEVMIFINPRSFFTGEQLENIYETAMYNEIALLYIENIQRDFSSNCKRYIIDNDYCEIY